MCGPSIFVACVLAAVSARGECKWDSISRAVQASLTDEKATTEFGFTNTGPRTITILEMNPSCGCTTSELAQRTYSPGERGTVKVTTSLGNHVGTLAKSVDIVVGEGTTKTTTRLTATIKIPVPIKMDTESVSWDKGAPAVARTVRLLMLGDAPIHIIELKSSHQGSLRSLVRVIKAGREYEIELTPIDTKVGFDASVLVRTDFQSGGPEKRFAIQASVR